MITQVLILIMSFIINSNCQIYTVKKGDTCWSISQSYNISLDKFYSLNPGIKCENLQIQQRVNVVNVMNTSDMTKLNSKIKGECKISFEQFVRALTDNGYGPPSVSLYNSFISRISDGNITSKRELAMFLANIIWESGGLAHKKEIKCLNDGCPDHYRCKGDTDGIFYFGRGYIQLTWSYNYREASKSLFGDDRLVKNPELVSENEEYAWRVSFWFWKVNVHNNVESGKFGNSIKAINGGYECNPCRGKCENRKEIYSKLLKIFKVNEKPDFSGC